MDSPLPYPYRPADTALNAPDPNRKPLEDLIALAALPSIDGFLFAFLATGVWSNLPNAITFGLTALGGAGTFAAAAELTGPLRGRLGRIMAAYVGIMAFTLASCALQPVLAPLMPANMPRLTAIFLFGLSLRISRIGIAQRFANLFQVDAAARIALALTGLGLVMGGQPGTPSLQAGMPEFVFVATLAGAAITLAGGLVGYLSGGQDLRPLRFGAAASLGLMGINLLTGSLPPLVVLIPIGIGVALVLGRVVRDVIGAKTGRPSDRR